ncbi:MAG: hypothetical protein DRJ03_25590, partial [Chloroflexi bacterium]
MGISGLGEVSVPPEFAPPGRTGQYLNWDDPGAYFRMGVVDAAEGAKLLLPPGQLDTEIYTVLGGTSEGVDIMQRAALGEQGLPDIAFRKTHVAAYYD